MNYVALQVKTSYSILNSLNEVTKLIQYAKSLGYTSLAITDTNNMFGVPEFYNECKKNNIKPIIGIELSINNSKILLYAMNNEGYKNLIKLSTIISDNPLTIEDLKTYKDNLILVIPYKYYNEDIYNIYNIKYIGYSTKEEQEQINKPKVLINDVSYLTKEQHLYLDYLIMIKESITLGEYEFNKNINKHLLTKEEVESISDSIDIQNTKDISNMCNVEISYQNNLLPIYDKNINAFDYLKYLCQKGLKRRLHNQENQIYTKRLEYELDIINKMNFCNYFLIVWDYVKYAKTNNILVGPGRGSAAGSLVSYVLGITDIDPIKYDLLFERFLNPERITMPDIDVDFDSEKRQEVIDYVTEKYGIKKVAGIITFDTLAPKQVIRDVSRVNQLPLSQVDEICSLLTEKTLLLSKEKNIRLQRLINNNYNIKKIFDIAYHLEGLPRNIGIHASGIVMSCQDIDKTVPLYKTSKGIYVTAYSMNYLEPLGLLKMDFLGISNLTLINEVITNIKEKEHLNITLSNIPIDDKKTLEIFKSGKTDGIFQFESYGMRNFLKKLSPNSFDDIVVALALYRPGAMNYIDNYIARKEGIEEIDYIDSSLEPILKPTYGIIIYQEQIMQIAQVLANYTLGEADILRRAIGKKKEEILIKEKPKFIENAIKNGYSKEIATKIYDLILKFANYGFNKSHSVGYATVAYKMAFLKTYFFKYFETAILNNVIGNEKKTKIYITEIKQQKIKILPPDINLSDEKYTITKEGIRCPLSIIKNVGFLISNEIIKERQKGNYTSFIDFVSRTYSIGINRKVLISLISAGCFSNFEYNEKTLINNLDIIINYTDLSKDAGMISIALPELIKEPDYTQEEKIFNQQKCFGFYLSNHPINIYKTDKDIFSNEINLYFEKLISIVLIVDNIKEITTKKNDIMAFITASDEFGQLSLTMFPKTYKQYQKQLSRRNIVRFYGKVEKRYDQYQIIINSLQILN